MQIIKYTFDVPVVAMVSHIPAKSRMAVNYINNSTYIKHLLQIFLLNFFLQSLSYIEVKI